MDCGSLRRRRGSAAFALLRTRSERPRCRPAEERDEVAPSSLASISRACERIAHLSYGRRLLHCGISLRLMTAVGQNAKNSH